MLTKTLSIKFMILNLDILKFLPIKIYINLNICIFIFFSEIIVDLANIFYFVILFDKKCLYL